MLQTKSLPQQVTDLSVLIRIVYEYWLPFVHECPHYIVGFYVDYADLTSYFTSKDLFASAKNKAFLNAGLFLNIFTYLSQKVFRHWRVQELTEKRVWNCLHCLSWFFKNLALLPLAYLVVLSNVWHISTQTWGSSHSGRRGRATRLHRAEWNSFGRRRLYLWLRNRSSRRKYH